MREGCDCGGTWSGDLCRRAWQRGSPPLGPSCWANRFSGGRLHRDGSLAERGGRNLALGVRRRRLLLRRAESSVLPATRQQLLRALPENRFCNRGSDSEARGLFLCSLVSSGLLTQLEKLKGLPAWGPRAAKRLGEGCSLCPFHLWVIPAPTVQECERAGLPPAVEAEVLVGPKTPTGYLEEMFTKCKID
ncbi:unnamed protein product [Rangifer tarandus platyrhynchus]|uniref:Uncharacterized protein n=1 Tax=Rangifer tarandus platyrhynchus TaxID=3082113 RepID=A0ACB1MKX9_RANTA